MPIPGLVAKTNRFTFNPVVRLFAGRVPPLAIVEHRGRSSGTAYRTPVLAFPAGDGFAIALTYGRGTDWERNVLAANGCTLVYRNRRYRLADPRHIPLTEARRDVPVVIRAALRLLRVGDALRLDGRQQGVVGQE